MAIDYCAICGKVFKGLEICSACKEMLEEQAMAKKCADCTNDGRKAKLVFVIDPDNETVYRRAYLCKEHREQYQNRGYLVKKHA